MDSAVSRVGRAAVRMVSCVLLNYPANPGFLGAFDGFTATLTSAAKAGAFASLAKFLADYVNATMTELGNEPKSQREWAGARSSISGYIQNGQLVLSVNSSNAINAPLTAPTGTTVSGAAAPGAYAGYRTGSIPRTGQTLALLSSVGYAR